MNQCKSIAIDHGPNAARITSVLQHRSPHATGFPAESGESPPLLSPNRHRVVGMVIAGISWAIGASTRRLEETMKIRFPTVDSVLDEMDAVRQRVAARVAQLFEARGGGEGRALDDWIEAERETVWRPALEVVKTPEWFVIEAALASLDPKQLDLRVTRHELLLTADVHHADREQEGEVLLCEFATGPLFRTHRFPGGGGSRSRLCRMAKRDAARHRAARGVMVPSCEHFAHGAGMGPTQAEAFRRAALAVRSNAARRRRSSRDTYKKGVDAVDRAGRSSFSS